jgi:selenide,water dikinase
MAAGRRDGVDGGSVDGMASTAAWRRWTGIEPAGPRYSGPTVLRTAETTRYPHTSTATLGARSRDSAPGAGCDLAVQLIPDGEIGWAFVIPSVGRVVLMVDRLTSYAHGGGCACKIPAGELERMVAGLLLPAPNNPDSRLVVGLDSGDDAAVVTLAASPGLALVSTVDFFTPVVDDPYDWGRIAAANALSDIYAMGGRPILGLNLLCWPRDVLPVEMATEVLRGGLAIAIEAGIPLAGGHSVDDPEPKYGLAVTGVADPDRLLRNDRGIAGVPLSLTKPLGLGVLNNRHKVTGEVFEHAIDCMTTLNAAASAAALAAGVTCATDVTGFGLLGHAYKLARASGVTVRVDSASVPYLADAREAAHAGYISGGTKRNLDWVLPYTNFSDSVDDVEQLLLADAQTSGGLLIAGEVPGATVIGELVPAGRYALEVR